MTIVMPADPNGQSPPCCCPGVKTMAQLRKAVRKQGGPAFSKLVGCDMHTQVTAPERLRDRGQYIACGRGEKLQSPPSGFM